MANNRDYDLEKSETHKVFTKEYTYSFPKVMYNFLEVCKNCKENKIKSKPDIKVGFTLYVNLLNNMKYYGTRIFCQTCQDSDMFCSSSLRVSSVKKKYFIENNEINEAVILWNNKNSSEEVSVKNKEIEKYNKISEKL